MSVSSAESAQFLPRGRLSPIRLQRSCKGVSELRVHVVRAAVQPLETRGDDVELREVEGAHAALVLLPVLLLGG